MADKPAQQNAKIGLISRIDASSDGFRKGLLDAIFHILKETEGTHFNILVGGLVGKKSLAEKIKAYVAAMVRNVLIASVTNISMASIAYQSIPWKMKRIVFIAYNVIRKK